MKRFFLILLCIVFLCSNAYSFDFKLPFFGESPKSQEIAWRDLVQLDYKNNYAPPQLQQLNRKIVKIPGYAVPVEGDEGFESVSEFLLVPVFGMCIHIPPPPPNQVVYVKMKEAVPVEKLFDAIWLTGQLSIETNYIPSLAFSDYKPESGFLIEGLDVEIYQFGEQ